MIRRPPRSTQSRSSAASDVYKRQGAHGVEIAIGRGDGGFRTETVAIDNYIPSTNVLALSLIHISEPTRPY